MTLVTEMMLPPPAEHPLVARLGAQERAAEVHRMRVVPLLSRDLVPRESVGVGGVGNEHVDIAELRPGRGHRGLDLGG